MKVNKTILIIGGMGPTASWHAHRLLLDKCSSIGVKNNDDYPTIIHLSINVTDFINGNDNDAESGFNYIKQKLSTIDMDSIDIGFIACNTAHILFDRINEFCDNKLISIVDVASTYIDETKYNVGIVCSPFTAAHNIYKCRELLFPSQNDLERLNNIIRDVIRDNIEKDLIENFKDIIRSLCDKNCKRVVIGCSELSILADIVKNDFNPELFIDPISLTVDRLVDGKQ